MKIIGSKKLFEKTLCLVMLKRIIATGISLVFLYACKSTKKEDAYVWKPIQVTVSAYNSVPSQTANHPSLAAWGDTLRPGMKVVAVSRDLMRKGLRYNTPIKIEGLEGIYIVKDKMHYRWQNKIDLYMGKDVKSAKEWGRKKLTIEYGVKKKDLNELNQ